MIISPLSKVEMSPLLGLKAWEVLYEGEDELKRSRAPKYYGQVDQKILSRKGYSVPVLTLLGKLGRRKAIENYPTVFWKHPLFVSVEHRKGAKEPMIVVSNREFSFPLKLYRWRWGIESLFECLKTRGFRMEETHMIDPIKIEKLLFILAIAVCWAYKIGELQARKAPITVKNHGRKLKSIFRLGLDLIRRALFREDESLSPGIVCLSLFMPYSRGSCSMTFFRVQSMGSIKS